MSRKLKEAIEEWGPFFGYITLFCKYISLLCRLKDVKTAKRCVCVCVCVCACVRVCMSSNLKKTIERVKRALHTHKRALHICKQRPLRGEKGIC